MSSIFALRRAKDQRYEYGLSVTKVPVEGELFVITAVGDGQYPAFAPKPATQEEHDAWLRRVEAAGFTVTIAQVPATEIERNSV